jgi:broad specificity phosphatase PhoE
MKLLIARHGETDLNIDERFQGSSDAPLNARGQAQAESLAQRLPRDILQVVSSPQRRAVQTAQAVCAPRGLTLATQADFREREFGAWEGLTPAEAQAQDPALWSRGVPWVWEASPPGAESPHEVVTRVARGLRQMLDAHAPRSTLLVAHGFVVRALRFLIEGLEPAQFFVEPRIANASFIAYDSLNTHKLRERLQDWHTG